MKKVAIAVVGLLACGNMAFAAIPQVEYKHTVTRAKPVAYGKYIVQEKDSTSELITEPGGTDLFKDGSGKVVSSKKHAEMWKIPDPAAANNNEKIVKAKSPLIPGKISSFVFVEGLFKVAGAGNCGADTAPEEPQWASMLKESGVHVILIHEYDDEDNDWTFALRSSAKSLEKQYKGPDDSCYIVSVGSKKDIESIAGLPAYLNKKGVKKGDVITLDTLGHGFLSHEANFCFHFLKSANGKGLDYVGREEEFQAPGSTFEKKMETPVFCSYFKDFLRADAFIGLYHCWSGEKYKVPGGDFAPSILEQVLAAVGPDRSGCGVSGIVTFSNTGVPYPTAPGYFVFAKVSAK